MVKKCLHNDNIGLLCEADKDVDSEENGHVIPFYDT